MNETINAIMNLGGVEPIRLVIWVAISACFALAHLDW